MSAHLSGQKAAIVADMAIAPIPVSTCTDEIIELGKDQGLPELADYGVALVMGNNPSSPALAAAEHFSSPFQEKAI